jgi:GntR family transcriptional regulator
MSRAVGEARVDRGSGGRTLSEDVAGRIATLARERGLGPGDALPSEPHLARLFHVGRTTVREALVSLANDGWVVRSRGSRTVITPLFQRPVLGLEVLEPLEQLARRQGWDCGTEGTSFAAGAADEAEATKLQIDLGSPVTRLSRVKTIDGEPLALMRSVIPEATASEAELRREFRDSITRLMARSRPLRFAESEVGAASCGDELGVTLGLSPGDPVIVLEELFFADMPVPLLWNTNWIVPGRIRVELLRRPPRGSPNER